MLMTTGIILIQACKYSIKSEETSSEESIIMESVLNTFYQHNFAGRVVMVLSLGAGIWSLILFGAKNTNK